MRIEVPATAPNRSLRATRHGGFTLIELMVVLVLIGIVTAAILPEMRGTHADALLRSASRDLIQACHLACSRAVSRNQLHRLSLDPGTGRFQIETRATGSSGDSPFVPVRGLHGTHGEIDPRITVALRSPSEPAPAPAEDPDASGPGQAWAEEKSEPGESGPPRGIRFFPDGTADGLEILLRERDGPGLALRVNPITARVRIVPLQSR